MKEWLFLKRDRGLPLQGIAMTILTFRLALASLAICQLHTSIKNEFFQGYLVQVLVKDYKPCRDEFARNREDLAHGKTRDRIWRQPWRKCHLEFDELLKFMFVNIFIFCTQLLMMLFMFPAGDNYCFLLLHSIAVAAELIFILAPPILKPSMDKSMIIISHFFLNLKEEYFCYMMSIIILNIIDICVMLCSE
ncbi:MAG: hypothetical protein MHMPM18_004774 [Marteilia pararefringens]